MPHSAFRLQDARVGRESGARFAAPYEPVMGARHATLPPTVWRGSAYDRGVDPQRTVTSASQVLLPRRRRRSLSQRPASDPAARADAGSSRPWPSPGE